MNIITYNNSLIIDVGVKYGLNVKMKYRCLIDNQETKTLSIQWDVYFEDNNGNRTQTLLLRSFTKEQIATNEILVDPLTGNFVLTDFENHENLIGEYDFYWQLVNNSPVNLPQLILAAGNRFKNKIYEII